MKIKDIILLFFIIIVLVNCLNADELSDFETLENNTNPGAFFNFFEKYPKSTKADEAKYLFFTQFPTLTNLILPDNISEIVKSITPILDKLFKTKKYNPRVLVSPDILTPYKILVTVDSEDKLFPGNLPALDKHTITVTLQKCIAERSQTHTVSTVYENIFEKSFSSDFPNDIENFVGIGASSIHELLETINNSLLNKIKAANIPEALNISYPEPEIVEKPSIQPDDDDNGPDNNDLPAEVETLKIPIKYDNYMAPKGFELGLHFGFGLTSTESDNGGDAGTAEPQDIQLKFDAILQDVEIADCFVPHLSFNAFLISEAEEIWLLQYNQLSGMILDINLFLELDFQRLLRGEKSEAFISFGDTAGIYVFAGAGLVVDIISLARTSLYVIANPQPDETIDAVLFGLGWSATAQYRGLFTPAIYINLNLTNALLFGSESTYNYAVTVMLGYDIVLKSHPNIDKTHSPNIQTEEITMKASVAFEFSLGHSEFVLTENDKFTCDFTCFCFKFSIIL